MPQDKIVTSLGLLRERKEEMLRLLDQRADAALLAEVAHMLASAAGMFGFVAVSRVAREFEYVVTRKPKLAGPIAKQLRVETGAALAELDELLREGWMLPA
jgi:HPt (histidine-containing phosphotransfer) domain-containing protein